MIGRRCSLIALISLCTTVIFVIYQFEQLNNLLFPTKSTNHSYEWLNARSDLNNCILSFFQFHRLHVYLNNANKSYPIYLSFHSRPLPYDDIGKECTALFYNGQEKQTMKMYESTCFYPFIITDKERREIQTALKVIKTSFDDNNLELVLTGGSFIGSWRYHQIIPYDDDIDFYIRTEQKPRIRKLLEKLSQNESNRFLFRDTESTNQHWKLAILCRNNSHGPCKIEIDFFFMKEEEFEMRFLEWPMSFLKSDYLPLKQRPFENILFKVPNNFHSYIRNQYKTKSNICVFKNHAEKNSCVEKLIDCDLLRYRYPYKVVGNYKKVFIELIVYKMKVQSIFIDLLV